MSVADVKDKLLGKLSKGYRQRVGLAQAIIHNPDVLILDEPTSGLDPKQINETRDLIKSLAGDHTIILSTHILPEVEQTCQSVLIINKGRLVAKDSVTTCRIAPVARSSCYRNRGARLAMLIRRGMQQRLERVPGITPHHLQRKTAKIVASSRSKATKTISFVAIWRVPWWNRAGI